MVLKTAIDNAGNSAFNPNPDPLNTLFSLTRSGGAVALPWQGDTFEWSWIIAFASCDKILRLQLQASIIIEVLKEERHLHFYSSLPPPPLKKKKRQEWSRFALVTLVSEKPPLACSAHQYGPQSARKARLVRPSTLPGSSFCRLSRGSGQLPKSNIHTHIPRLVLWRCNFKVPWFSYYKQPTIFL